MRIEILHTRDSDGGCDQIVFLDGQALDPDEFHVEDVDPGRGYTLEDWDESTRFVDTNEDLTKAFRDAVVAARNAERLNPYIDGRG